MFFGRLTKVADGGELEPVRKLFTDAAAFDVWWAKWSTEADPVTQLSVMRAVNPVRIPRNHRVEEAIQNAYRGEYTPFHRLVDALASPYTDNAEYSEYEVPPRPEEIVRETFCGT